MTDDERPRRSLLYFLVASLLLHGLLLAILRNRPFVTPGNPDAPIVVKLLGANPTSATQPAPPVPPPASQQAKVEKQIVAPSDQENELPPLGRAFLSDRDNRVDQETVKKGNPEAGAPGAQQAATAPAAPPPPPPPAPAAPPPRAAPPRAAPAPPARAAAPRPAAPRDAPARAAPPPRSGGSTLADRAGQSDPAGERAAARKLPGLDQLFAPPADVLARADTEADTDGGPADDRPAGAGSKQRPDPRADRHRDLVSAPPPAPGLFGGLRGTFDDLPGLAQGNLTLLNTKADRFAPFVRRVGTRVFQNLLINQRRDLGPDEILAAREVFVVHATLDPSGKLRDLEVQSRSGSLAVDQTLLDACRDAAFDANPPKSAANDRGDFEFVFVGELRGNVVAGPRGPTLSSVESRLRVGLL